MFHPSEPARPTCVAEPASAVGVILLTLQWNLCEPEALSVLRPAGATVTSRGPGAGSDQWAIVFRKTKQNTENESFAMNISDRVVMVEISRAFPLNSNENLFSLSRRIWREDGHVT